MEDLEPDPGCLGDQAVDLSFPGDGVSADDVPGLLETTSDLTAYLPDAFNPDLGDTAAESFQGDSVAGGDAHSHPDTALDPAEYLLDTFNPNLGDPCTQSYPTFISQLATATLSSRVEPLPLRLLQFLQQAPDSILEEPSRDDKFAIELFLASSNASEATYKETRRAILRRHPSDEVLMHHLVEKLVSDLSGVDPIVRDACINTYIAFTGPFFELTQCPYCNEPRYRPGSNKVPNSKFSTFPLGTQLQALWRSPKYARHMNYRKQYTDRVTCELRDNGGRRVSPYSDFFDGDDYMTAVHKGEVAADDTVVMLSLDGAQLYRNKASDCWMYIWIVMNLPPDMRYKKCHVIPGACSGRVYWHWTDSWMQELSSPVPGSRSTWIVFFSRACTILRLFVTMACVFGMHPSVVPSPLVLSFLL